MTQPDLELYKYLMEKLGNHEFKEFPLTKGKIKENGDYEFEVYINEQFKK